MIYIYYDCGTTNTRGYLIKNGVVLDSATEPVGSRDTSITGSVLPFMEALMKIKASLLGSSALNGDEVDGLFLSGMATSKYGVKDVPHTELPADLEKLKKSIVYYNEDEFLHCKVGLIPGLKSVIASVPETFDEVARINNLRGEETELFGVLQMLGNPSGRYAIILPGSHTHVLFTENGTVYEIVSTITGELYRAVSENTVISGSVGKGTVPGMHDMRMIEEGYQLLCRYGINRALYIIHASNLFGTQTVWERTCALNGIIEGGAVNRMLDCFRDSRSWPDHIVVAGSRKICNIYKAILSFAAPCLETDILTPDGAVPFSVRGFLALMNSEEC